MKKIILLFIILSSIKGFSQYEDKAFYLLDSVSLENITDYDKNLLNNELTNYRKSKLDTIKFKALQNLSEKLNSEELWPRYNELMYKLSEEKLLKNQFSNKREEILINEWYASAINNMGFLAQAKGNLDEALKYYNQCLLIHQKVNNQGGIATTLSNIGIVNEDRGKIKEALDNYEKSLAIRIQIHDSAGMAVSINNIGVIYYNQGNIEKALEYWHKCLKIKENLGEVESAAYTLNNLGQIYNSQKDIETGIKYYEKSLADYEKVGNIKGASLVLSNLGASYNSLGNPTKALEHYQKSLKMRTEIGDKWGMSHSNYNISAVYYDMGRKSNAPSKIENLKTSLTYCKNGLNIAIEIDDKQMKSVGYAYVAQTELALGLLPTAKENAEKSLELAKELGYPDKISEACRLLYLIHNDLKNWKEALTMYSIHIQMRDSFVNEENYKKSQKQLARYEYEKKAATDSISNAKAMEIKNIELSRSEEVKKKQRVVIYSFIIGFIIIIIFSIIIFRLFTQKKRANLVLAQKNIEVEQKNEEITSQRDEIEAQRNEISKHRDLVVFQKEEIEASINYAQRIQRAVLPPDELLQMFLNDFFILFQPKDIVSGDFYWATIIKNWQILTVADCTGHGVPGAFMSMLGVSFLNEIVRKQEVTKASEVLNHLRKSVIESLQQTGESGTQKDGMDMSLAVIDIESNQLQWAGANNPLWIIKGPKFQNQNSKSQDETSLDLGHEALITELVEVKPDKMPIAIYERMVDFTNHELQLSEGDILYLMSDGYEDQFGGPKEKKFLSKNLKQLLLENCQKSMYEQKEILETTLANWIGNGEQIDDITILGIKI